MHYESDDDSSIFPNKVIESANVLDETKENENFSLPQEDVNENRVFDRSKSFLLKFGGLGPSFVQFRSSCFVFSKVVQENFLLSIV